MKYKKIISKTDKFALREVRRQRRLNSLKGDGEYLFVNNTRGDLVLGKKPIKSPLPANPCTIPIGQTFIGDSYFLNLMRSGEIRLIEVIQPATNERMNMPDQKLILDQPNRFTNQGQTEHVVPEDKNMKPLIENQPQKQPVNDKLLIEAPLEGVEILLN